MLNHNLPIKPYESKTPKLFNVFILFYFSICFVRLVNLSVDKEKRKIKIVSAYKISLTEAKHFDSYSFCNSKIYLFIVCR